MSVLAVLAVSCKRDIEKVKQPLGAARDEDFQDLKFGDRIANEHGHGLEAVREQMGHLCFFSLMVRSVRN